MKNNKMVGQHKRMAMGGMVMPGGANSNLRSMLPQLPNVAPTIRGPLNPVVLAKRQNGIPGMKKGGRVKK